MREFTLFGVIKSVDQRTSKTGSPYTIVVMEDKDGIVEVIAGGKVDVPPQGSSTLCKGFIKTTPREYQGKTFYSYSFSAFVFEVCSEQNSVENSLQEVSFSEEEMPF